MPRNSTISLGSLTRLACAAALLLLPAPASAAGASGLVRAAVKSLMARLERKAGTEAAKKMSARLVAIESRYGPRAVQAIERAGPRGYRAVLAAGPQEKTALQVLERFGPGGLAIAARRGSLRLVEKYGDGAAAAIIKHPGIAEPFIGKYGGHAARAMRSLSGRGARRLVMLGNKGMLRTADRDRLLDILAQYGDKGMNFVWKHKGVFIIGTALTSFYQDPRPYIDGVKQLAVAGIDRSAAAAATTATGVGGKIAAATNWTVVFSVCMGLCLVAIYAALRRRQARLETRRQGQAAAGGGAEVSGR